MPGYAALSATGRVAAGEMDTVFIPRVRQTLYGLILLHGMGYQYEFVDAAQPNSSRIASLIVNAGIPCIAGSFGGDIMGNDQQLGYVETAWSVLQEKAGVNGQKVMLYGESMGGGVAARFAEAYPDMVAAFIGAIPAVDLVDVYTNNRGGLGATIGTAWGTVYPNPLPSRADLASDANTALIANKFPVRLYYSSGDTIVVPSAVQNFATKVGGTATQFSSGPHGDSILSTLPMDEIITTLLANGS